MRDSTQDSPLGVKAALAAKWSIATQVIAKLISPVTTVILAHLLAPEAFAVIATVTMVVSFAEMFADAGFQKYLIQHEYPSESNFRLSIDVAFWTNFTIALLLWTVIAVFNAEIAKIVGNDGLGVVIVVASASIPLVSLSSVQTAVYQKALDFKTLFSSRVSSAAIVLVVAVPLALLGFDYWAMIVSTIASNLFLAVWLTVKSPWKPSFRYSFAMLKQMFSFSIWTLLEAFSIWITSWAGTFVLGVILSSYYLGMYKTSVSLVSAITGLASSAINPIIFSSLSRLQDNREKFDRIFYLMQKYLGIVLVPLAVCMFVFRDLFVGVLLGEQWLETSLFFGLYAAASAVVVVFCHTASEAYRSLGKPRISMAAQVCYLIILIPSLFVAANYGYFVFSIAIPIIRAVSFTLIHFFFCWKFIGLSPRVMLNNQKEIYGISIAVGLVCFVLVGLFSEYWQQVIVLMFGVISYLVAIVLVKPTREVFADLLSRLGLINLFNKLLPSSLKL